jgi:hypothetical protein
MRRLVLRAAFLVGCLGTAAPATAMPFTFATLPTSGAISGAPGTTIGWGYSITNPSGVLWLELTGLSADPVAHATLDLFIFDFPILAPLQTTNVPYDAVAGLGLAELTWDTTAPLGFVNAGTFQLEGAFYDDDPLGAGVFVADATAQIAPYTGTAQRNPATVPEPGIWLSLGAGMLALMRLRQRAYGNRNVRTRPNLAAHAPSLCVPPATSS